MAQPKHQAKHARVSVDTPVEECSLGIMGKGMHSIYVLLCVALLALPLVCMAWAPTTTSSEKKDLAPLPSLMVDGKPNVHFLSDAGAYFEDHFAFRNELVDADALLKERVLHISATDRVIVGRDGWLFYKGTLNDYQRTNLMSDRAIFNAAHNVALVQEFVEGRGASFAVGIAPNKNSLYPRYMPYYLLRGTDAGNLARFEQEAGALGVHLVDLTSALSAPDQVLYYETDSHWTNEGARIAYEALMAAVGRAFTSLEGTETASIEHLGDVAVMLRPLSATPEEDIAYAGAQQYEYVEGDDVEDTAIQTRSTRDKATGSLVIYRDSFGNALVPYLGSEYADAFFSKLLPYDMGEVARREADTVLFERAERHLSSYATTPPYMYSPQREIPDLTVAREMDAATASVRINGPYLQIGGCVEDPALQSDSLIYVDVAVGDKAVGLFEAFLVSSQAEAVSDVDGASEPGADEVTGDGGYRAFLQASAFEDVLDTMRIKVYVMDGNVATCVLDSSVSEVFVDSE